MQTKRGLSARFALLLCLAAAGAVGVSAYLHNPARRERRLAHASLSDLQQELRREGPDAPLLFQIGRRLNERKQFQEAADVLDQAVRIDPDSYQLRDEWTHALADSHQQIKALQQLEEFARTHPQTPEAHYLLGRFYSAQHAMGPARDQLQRAIDLKPDEPEAYFYLAAAASELNDWRNAQAAAEKAVSLNPNSARYHLLLGSLKLHNNDPREQVAQEYRRAAELAPKDALTRREYAKYLLTSALTPEDRNLAAQQAREAIALGVLNPSPHFVLGRALLYNGDKAGAISPLMRAAELAPDDPAPALALAQTYRTLAQEKEAAHWRQEYGRRQHYTQAKTALAQVVVDYPSQPEPRLKLARFLGQHGDGGECRNEYATALRLPVDAPDVLIATARALLSGGHRGTALPLAQQAISRAANSPDAHETLGDILLANSNKEAAAGEYDVAGRLDPQRAARLRNRLSSAPSIP